MKCFGGDQGRFERVHSDVARKLARLLAASVSEPESLGKIVQCSLSLRSRCLSLAHSVKFVKEVDSPRPTDFTRTCALNGHDADVGC